MAGSSKRAIAGGASAVLLAILSAVFANEGGYVNDPKDPGGATNHGITEAVARRHGFDGDMRELKKHCTLPDEICADRILIRDYVEKPGFMPFTEIEPAVAKELVDTGVNMGPYWPARFLQQSLNELGGAGLAVDGRIGPATVSAYVRYRDATGVPGCVAMLDRLDRRQLERYEAIVRKRPASRKFLRGWKNKRIGNVPRAECAQGI